MQKRRTLQKLIFIAVLAIGIICSASTSYADHDKGCRYGKDCYAHEKADPKQQPVDKKCSTCGPCNCRGPIERNHMMIRKHMTDEFMKHRDWLVEIFFQEHILPAMGRMAAQLSTVAMDQAQMIGRFFDAKHQMETQRLFQKLMAEAHKDYQPSEGLCEIGTSIRSLAASSRKSDLGHMAFANRTLARQLRNGDVISTEDVNSDLHSRIKMFAKNHCNKRDNANGLNELCKNADAEQVKKRMNKDVNFTRTLESQLTIDADFTKENVANTTPDEEDVFALSANLFGHIVTPVMTKATLATEGNVPLSMARNYMDLRSVVAKRSVAQNSFAAMAAERAKGDKEVAPFLKKIVTELGIKPEEVDHILGEEPSYFAQMEVLTKDIYQNPTFYTELYDKPANVTRKAAALRAINLMQERDVLKSQLRTEAALAVMLETMLHAEHERVHARLRNLTPKERGKDE